MSDNYTFWHRNGLGARKRDVRVERLGKTFMIYENNIRSEPYYFGDLVHRGEEAGATVFGLEDGLKKRPHWALGLRGQPPEDIAGLLPKPGRFALTNTGILIMAFLCFGIVYFGIQ